WHALRARLRRERAAVALITLLAVGLGEPLLCIIHCQVWLPLIYDRYVAAQYQHDHHHHGHHMMNGMVMMNDMLPAYAASVPDAIAPAQLPAGDSGCYMLRASGNHDGTPFHVPQSPVHDVLPALLLLIAPVLFASIRPPAPPGDPPRRAWR